MFVDATIRSDGLRHLQLVTHNECYRTLGIYFPEQSNSVNFDKLDQAKLIRQSAPGISSLIEKASTAYV